MTVHARREPTTPKEKSRELQRKLYLAAKRNRNRRFHALYDRIVQPDVLWRAFKEVKANNGRPGIDGQSIEDIKRIGPEQYLKEIASDLKAYKYRPSPVLRVEIPKTDGRKRPLGIPTVRDRIVEQALKIVIEPIFEASFLPCSYGYRPKRSAVQAMTSVKKTLFNNWAVLDADIEGFFDQVDHNILMGLIRRRISDRRVLKLIKQCLTAGVIIQGKRHKTKIGVPQGSPVSPLLANTYLHALDRWWQDHFSGIGELCRYCDDFVVICQNRKTAEKAHGLIAGFLKLLKLNLHPSKTKVVEVASEGFDFLGFHFRKLRSKRTGRLVPYAWPSQKAMSIVRGKIRELTKRDCLHVGASELTESLNRVIRGWRAYFLQANSTKKLADLDRYLHLRLLRFFRKRSGSRGRFSSSDYEQWKRHSGLLYFYPKGRCGITALHAVR